jgi:gamma-glutamylcyclotransferase (GGCT)/AIG2-like uncharacterized protein YtfP
MTQAGLFVYGTLKQGEYNFPRVEQLVERVERGCYVLGELYDLGPYPALLTPGGQEVRGELLVSDSLDELLRVTDAIEGDEYTRVLIEVRGSGPPRQAWTYRYARDVNGLRRIESGEWIGEVSGK